MKSLLSKMTVQLAQPPTVINAPPSQKTNYPAMAILVDSADLDICNDDDDVQIDTTKSPDDEGYELTGFFRTDPTSNDYVVGTTYRLDQDTTISQIGTIHMRGRLWVAARLDSQREQMEQEIALAFYADRGSPGRLQVSVAGVEISGVKIPFGVATALLEDKIQWNSEFAFAERLWTYMPFMIDVPLMIPRTEPMTTDLVLMLSEDLTTVIDTPDDVVNVPDINTFSVSSDGDVTQTS